MFLVYVIVKKMFNQILKNHCVVYLIKFSFYGAYDDQVSLYILGFLLYSQQMPDGVDAAYASKYHALYRGPINLWVFEYRIRISCL